MEPVSFRPLRGPIDSGTISYIILNRLEYLAYTVWVSALDRSRRGMHAWALAGLGTCDYDGPLTTRFGSRVGVSAGRLALPQLRFSCFNFSFPFWTLLVLAAISPHPSTSTPVFLNVIEHLTIRSKSRFSFLHYYTVFLRLQRPACSSPPCVYERKRTSEL